MLLGLVFLGAAQGRALLTGLTCVHQGNVFVFQFKSTTPVLVNHFTLGHPHRLVIDFSNAELSKKITLSAFQKQWIRSMRSAKQPNGDLRVVFDLKPNFKATWDKKVMVRANTSQIERLKQPKDFKKIIVVIDPGHGGKDPGATSPHGLREKTVVLSIAKALKKNIDRMPGFEAVLTRNRDVYYSLRERLNIARRYQGQIFIAIHADAFRNTRARGASIFALSQRGATSEAARWLAQRENNSELMGGVDLSNKENILKSVLINLSQTATVKSSVILGQHILGHIARMARLHHGRIEQAAFVVLKSPDIPSLLIETGFLSNRQEAKLLGSRAYQAKMAKAIQAGILEYFTRYPPRDSWLRYAQAHHLKI
jgi:N-acetylmuramoyl-L-alanine amidase